jgi:hypothetical protein
MIAWDKKCWLWATKKPFSPTVELYQTPLPNIDRNGLICWGEINMIPTHPSNCLKIWQNFVESNFNLDYIDNKSQSFPENIYGLYAKIQSKNNYPNKDLISVGITPKEVLETLLDNTN